MHGENDNRNNNGIDIGKTAVAIEYVPGEAAPKILATGKGVILTKLLRGLRKAMCLHIRTISLLIHCLGLK